MRSKPLETLFNEDGCRIELISRGLLGSMAWWPKTYIHFTDNPRDAASILRNGFDLKYCGRSVKKYGVSSEYRHDPCGVYAIEDEGFRNGGSPYVLFEAEIGVALYYSRKDARSWSACGKSTISQIYGNKIGRPLRTALLKDGIEAVFSDSELIILDPELITIIGGSTKL